MSNLKLWLNSSSTYNPLYMRFPSTTFWFCNLVFDKSTGNVASTPVIPAIPPLMIFATNGPYLKTNSLKHQHLKANRVIESIVCVSLFKVRHILRMISYKSNRVTLIVHYFWKKTQMFRCKKVENMKIIKSRVVLILLH